MSRSRRGAVNGTMSLLGPWGGKACQENQDMTTGTGDDAGWACGEGWPPNRPDTIAGLAISVLLINVDPNLPSLCSSLFSMS
jgi:hypothetical protein